MVITALETYSRESRVRFSIGLNPASNMLKCDGEKLSLWFWLDTIDLPYITY